MSFGKGGSEQSSQVFDLQVPYLQNLYQQAQGLAQQQVAPVTAAAQDLTQQFLPNLGRVGRQLMDIGAGTTGPQQFLAARLGQSNPWLTDTIDALGEDIARQLGRTTGVGIAGEAAGVGGAYGGSRHGIREGMAAEEATRAFSDAATQLRFGDYAAQPAIAESLARTQLAGNQAAVQVPTAAYNLGMAQYNAPWLPIQQLAAALGRPTVLSSGESSQFSLGI